MLSGVLIYIDIEKKRLEIDMKKGIEFTLILPAYNEARMIQRTISDVQSYLNQRALTYEIIVSADGDDGTRELVSELAKSDPRIRVIGNLERRGKGYGIRQAVAISNGSIIGFADADNKTPITELDHLLPWFNEGYDLVIGSRSLKTATIKRRQPLYRRIGSILFGYFMRYVTGLHDLVDTQCGFKFFKREVALDLFARQKINGYMFDVEILYLAQHANYKLKQVGVTWQDDGDSRLNLLSGNIQNFLDVIKIRFEKLPIINSKKKQSNEGVMGNGEVME